MSNKNATFSVSLPSNPAITVDVYPGHYTTNHFHLSHFLDLDNLKTNSSVAKNVAKELVRPYLSNTSIDTIVCMEGTELIGAYLANELAKREVYTINENEDIYVVRPLSNVNRQLTFKSNIEKLITGHDTLLLISSISSGTTLNSAIEMLAYYGANLVGVSSLFNAQPGNLDVEVDSLFTREDIPGYKMYKIKECELCESGRKLDAIIMQGGYTNL